MNELPDPRDLISVGETAPPPHDPYAALRQQSYRRYVLGSLFASIGSNMQTVAIGWELYDRTNSAMALAWVGLVQALPIILFALPFGHMADRFDRRRLVMLGQSLTMLCSVGLAALSFAKGSVTWMYTLLFLGAMARAITWPASSALMPLLVPRHSFSNAVTWKSMTFQIASVSGPAVGGAVIALSGNPWVVYATTAGLTLVNLVFVSLIEARPATRSDEPMSVSALLAGLGFVWRTKVVLAAITLDLFAVLFGGATALLPIYAKDILAVGPTGLGWLRAAPAVGALVMGIALAHRRPFQHAGRTLLWVVTGFGLVMIVFGLSRSFPLSLLMLVLSGALDNISVVIRHSLVQLSTPDEMRGRVSAVNSVFISCSNELGEFESGTVAAWFGPVMAVVSGGIGTMLVVLAALRVWPQIKNLKSLPEAGGS